MKSLIFISLMFVASCAASDVLEFTDSNFKSEVDDRDLILVEFFAPWCGHCKRLAPEYEAAATALKSNDPPIPLAKVDCTEEKDTCSKYGVSGYPTLKVFRHGTPTDYSGPREKDGIVSYMKKQAGPKSKVLTDEDGFNKFIGNMDASIVGLFSDEDSSDYKAFKSVADSLFEDYRFAYTFSSELAEKYSVSNKVIVFRPKRLQSKFEDPHVVHEGANKRKDIENFIKDNVHGLCGHMTLDNAPNFKKPLLTAYYKVDYIRNPKGANYWRNRVMKAGKEFAGKNLYYSIANSDDFGQQFAELGLEMPAGSDSPPVVAIIGANGEKFPMKETFSVDNLKAFIQQYLDGELEQYLKSEPIPASNDGPVKVVVAKSFDEIVNDETKDVLIEFYAPWCGHCKNLEPKYNELGEKLAGDDNIVIAKMDATANDVPAPYNVRGFPTIYWAPKDKKTSPEKYEGGREVEDFIKFIKKKATSKPIIKTEL